MCVASYGVIPQTYIRAVPVSGPIGTSCPRAVSNACSEWGADGGGSGGSGRELQACMAPHYPGQPGSPVGTEVDHSSERRPWDRRPLAARPGHSAPSEQQVCAAYECCYLPLSEQRAELVRRLVASLTNGCQLPSSEFTTCPPPQQRAQFLIGKEADDMINYAHPSS